MSFLHGVLQPLNAVLFQVYNDEVTVAELLGFITGAWCVWLTVKAKISNFPVGIANAFFFLVLFLNAKLFADSALQGVYIALGFFGWYAWLKFGPQRQKLAVSSSYRWLAGGAVGTAISTAILWPILRSAHDVAPFLDALTTGLSLNAQALLSFKKVQNWFLWIAADLIYIPLYISKGLALTSGVYVIFLCMCFAGLTQWRVALRPIRKVYDWAVGERGESLLSDTQYMGPRAAETVKLWVEAWRRIPQDEYDRILETL